MDLPDTNSMTSGTEYDVFLSFRGPDTRQGFADCLYHFMADAGIRVYRDDDEILVGDKINVLLRDITSCKICMPIFSKTFASSKWCLQEVARMVELKKEIVPIFYDVVPEDLKLKTAVYRDDLRKHKAKFHHHEVEQWEEALKEVAKIKGRELKERGFGEFIKMLVKEILIKLRVRYQQVTDHVVGIEDQLNDTLNLLDTESGGVRYVGIYGMGGIGKTTLATVVFNRLSESFDSCCFIADVRETSERHGIEHLRRQLLKNLDSKFRGISEVVDYVKVISEISSKRKILIVLDDVSSREQMKYLVGKSSWFGSGSRIIITTRDTSVLEIEEEELDKSCLGQPATVSVLEMGTMNFSHALDLLSKRAFGKASPPDDDYRRLSDEVVDIAGGLPLAIEIIGSYLCRKDKGVWRETIAKLKKIPDRAVKKKLMISYEALEYEQRQIFLDIACLSDCMAKSYAMHMWEGRGFYPHTNIELLISMSLLKTTEGDMFWMHDQLKSLGREIVREESLKDHAKRSRIWIHEEAMDALQRKEVRESIEVLYVKDANKALGASSRSSSHEESASSENLSCSLTQEEFAGLSNLRFLKLEKVKLSGDFKGMLPNLRWLSWKGSPGGFKASNLDMPNLVILELSDAITNRQGQWNQIKISPSLKVLDLSYSTQLTNIPSLPKYVALQRLILRSCTNLVELPSSIEKLKSLNYLNLEKCYSLSGLPKEIGSLEALGKLILCSCMNLVELPSSIGKLQSLKYLNLEGCYSLRGLPNEIGSLENLKEIIITGNGGSFSLPKSFGNLKSLLKLEIANLRIKKLPYSISKLVKLKHLSFSKCCGIRMLPELLGNLESLIELNLRETEISELPTSIRELVKLERLILAGCKNILRLPESVGGLQSLVELDVSHTGLSKLPYSIGNLEELRRMRMEFCNIRELPASIGRLKKLEELHASHNWVLHVIPAEIGNLSCLRILSLSETGVRCLPSTVSQLTSLDTLNLDGCHELEELPELPASLTSLYVKSEKLQHASNLLKLTGLVDLAITSQTAATESSNLEVIRMLTRLKKLQLCLSDITTLPTELYRLSHLRSLELSCLGLECIPQLPPNLSELVLSRLMLNTELPNLSELKYLSSLQFYRSSIRTVLNSIRELTSLKDFSVKFCNSQLTRLLLPDGLSTLEIIRCNGLNRLPELSHLKNLNRLHVSDCEELHEIPGLGKLVALRELHISQCNSLTVLDNLSQLKKLENLWICNCEKLGDIKGLDSLDLKKSTTNLNNKRSGPNPSRSSAEVNQRLLLSLLCFRGTWSRLQ